MNTPLFLLWIATLLIGVSAYWLGQSHKRKAEHRFRHIADYCLGRRDDKP
jgi:hypothetical protein